MKTPNIKLIQLQDERLTLFETMLHDLEKSDKDKLSIEMKHELKYKIASKYVKEVKSIDNKIKIEERRIKNIQWKN